MGTEVNRLSFLDPQDVIIAVVWHDRLLFSDCFSATVFIL